MKNLFSKISMRFVIQLAIVATVFYLAITHLNFGIEKAAPIDAYCPFGAIESFFTLVFKGDFLQRIFTSSFLLLGVFLVTTLFLGRVFCGYFCPLGALQEWIRFIGRKLGLEKDFELPEKFDSYLRYVKYFILAAIVYFSFYLGDLVFRAYDPYNSLMHIGAEFEEKMFGYGILALVLISAIFAKGFWCRYFCPLGAFFGLIKKISFFKIKRNANTCIDCGTCNENCPAGLEIKTVKVVKDVDCLSCGQCVSHCPESSLSFNILGKKVSKKNFSLLIIILVILPLIILPYTPFWKTKPESNIINSEGEINTADIRGSNTLKYVLETTKVPLSEFQTQLGLPADVDVSLKLKDIGAKYNLKNKDGIFLDGEDFKAVIDEYIAKKKVSSVSSVISCPSEQTDCQFPGDCGSYIDKDGNGICDQSE